MKMFPHFTKRNMFLNVSLNNCLKDHQKYRFRHEQEASCTKLSLFRCLPGIQCSQRKAFSSFNDCKILVMTETLMKLFQFRDNVVSLVFKLLSESPPKNLATKAPDHFRMLST